MAAPSTSAAQRHCLWALLGLLLATNAAAVSLRKGFLSTSSGSGGSPHSQSFEHLKGSVLRLTVFRQRFHWSRPFDSLGSHGNLGSGFLVSSNPPTICTCAHVVSDASDVYVQVTEFGKTKFAGVVATINNDADIAIVVLKDPQNFVDTLQKANITLEPLKLAASTPPLGHNVVAPGFPLGQRTMTLSTGVISGVDHVAFHYTSLALQSTAIISSGNSGSPLLDADTQEVIGMNYAKNPREAQINYAVPLWKLKQVLAKHEELHGKDPVKHTYQFKMVNHGLIITPGYNALYRMSRGNQTCRSGPLISAIRQSSPFQSAVPAVSVDSFLVSIDGVDLDRYGQGQKSEYVQELVDFVDLMWMRSGTGEQEIEFETCLAATGQKQKHRMSLAWNPEREGSGVQYIYEPRLEQVDWEIFGELIFMDLTENHITQLDGEGGALVRFLDPAVRHQPHLAVMILKEGGEAEEALGIMKGRHLAIVDTINNVSVSSLAELRKHYSPGAMPAAEPGAALVDAGHSVAEEEESLWFMRTLGGREYATFFTETLQMQVRDASRGAPHLLTPGAREAVVRLGLLSPQKLAMLDQGGATLAESGRRVPSAPEDEEVWASQPLQEKKREAGVALLDFAEGEAINAW